MHARAAVPRAVCGEGGAAARTSEVQLGAALADLLQRLSGRPNLNRVSRPVELARFTATLLRCSRTAYGRDPPRVGRQAISSQRSWHVSAF